MNQNLYFIVRTNVKTVTVFGRNKNWQTIWFLLKSVTTVKGYVHMWAILILLHGVKIYSDLMNCCTS